MIDRSWCSDGHSPEAFASRPFKALLSPFPATCLSAPEHCLPPPKHREAPETRKGEPSYHAGILFFPEIRKTVLRESEALGWFLLCGLEAGEKKKISHLVLTSGMLLLAQSTGDSLKTKAPNKQETQTPTQKKKETNKKKLQLQRKRGKSVL